MELCEHGNSYHCQSCEVKQLKYVIEELINENSKYKEFIEWVIENYANGSSDKDFCDEVYEKALHLI